MATHAQTHAGHGAGPSLNRLALSATVHCLTGCAIGEVLGMIIGTALGWSNGATIDVAQRAGGAVRRPFSAAEALPDRVSAAALTAPEGLQPGWQGDGRAAP